MATPVAHSSSSSGGVGGTQPLTADDDARRKLNNYREIGFLGAGTFAEVTKHVSAAPVRPQFAP